MSELAVGLEMRLMRARCVPTVFDSSNSVLKSIQTEK